VVFFTSDGQGALVPGPAAALEGAPVVGAGLVRERTTNAALSPVAKATPTDAANNGHPAKATSGHRGRTMNARNAGGENTPAPPPDNNGTRIHVSAQTSCTLSSLFVR
jgi:hypothetical protein